MPVDSLDDFLEEIHFDGHDEPLGVGKACKIDGTAPSNNMRDRAGLGGALSCCDYLRIDDEGVVLIEGTHLGKTVLRMQAEYDAAADDDLRARFIRERIRRENCLKVYGTFLILCRMRMWPERCLFWLVITDTEPGAARVAANLNADEKLKSEIEGALRGEPNRQSPIDGELSGAQLVTGVETMLVDEFRELFTRRAAGNRE